MLSYRKTLTRCLAAATAISFVLTPIAQADRGRGRGGDDHGRWEHRSDDDSYRGDRRSGHGDYERGPDRDWRDDDRRERRRHRDDHDRDYDRYGYYSDRDYRPVVVYRPAYSSSRRSVSYSYGSSYGPYYYSGYRPRYDVGHYYSYGPRRTVYINNYDAYGLYEPPYGYQWVRDHDRGDAILASVATGAIIGLVIGALATD